MIRFNPPRTANGSGLVWAGTGTGTAPEVKDVFGPRPFSAHIATVGYDYDFHRGADIDIEAGENFHSVIAGHVVRLHRSHYGFETDAQLTYWETDDDSSGAAATFTRSGSNLIVTGTRGGSKTFPSVAKYKALTERVQNTGDFELRLKLGSTTDPAAGAIGFGILHEATGENIRMEWDGVNATALGAGSGGALSQNGVTSAVTTEPWFRIVLSGTTLTWAKSADAASWTTVATQTIASFTNTTQSVFTPLLYWRSTDTNGTPATASIDFFGWYDANGIDRFGNWVTVAQSARKVVSMHFQDILVELGDIVEAGEVLGLVGTTGFDARSGNINAPHVHIEYAANASPVYDNTDPINPLGPGLLPRSNVSNNVTVTRSSANDPDAVDCHRLRIQVTRAAQDFDVNEISLTGNTTSRTINFNTRSGLNVDNDIPKQSGVYIVPVDFDENSATYEFSVYFSKTVVGSTFVSAFVKDTGGTTLWSE